MHTFLEKDKQKDHYTLIFFIVFFLFGALLLTYYFWEKNQNTAIENTTVELTHNTQPQLLEAQRPRRVQTMRRPLPIQEAIFKCIDPRTGTMTLAQSCPEGFVTEKIETQDSTGIKPRRFQYTTPSNTKPQQQGQITVIPDIRIEIKKCDDYYNPKIRRIIQIGIISDNDLRKQLERLQENKERCLQGAKKGRAIITI